MLCTTSKVCAERVQWHMGVLAQPWSHSLGEKKIPFELTTTLYVLYASCTTCAIDLRFPERRSEVQQSKGLSIDSSLARIDT